jgi:two-component system, sensor histidine kinase and response regulator
MKILVADDDFTTRLMLKEVLRRWNHEVCQADSGQQAWEYFQHPDPPALAIVDWIMPGMSGPALCRKLKAEPQKQVPYLILLTSKNHQQDIVDGLDSGADDFMTKPCNIDELRARISVGERIVKLQQAVWQANENLEGRVRERTREVEHLLKLRDELIHHLSHDLKTPLTPLLSMLALLGQTEPSQERKQMLDLALEGACQIQRLSAQVLELCQAKAWELASPAPGVNLHDLAETAIDLCRAKARIEGRSLLNEVAPNVIVCADAVQVQRALAHLLDNALKFTAARGTIAVRATVSASVVTVAVADNGMGIDPLLLHRVFEPFFKADSSRHDRSAPGLGLAVVEAIVERQGGRAWADSAGLNQGTTIYFTLPGNLLLSRPTASLCSAASGGTGRERSAPPGSGIQSANFGSGYTPQESLTVANS